jgi:hypothetical protein
MAQQVMDQVEDVPRKPVGAAKHDGEGGPAPALGSLGVRMIRLGLLEPVDASRDGSAIDRRARRTDRRRRPMPAFEAGWRSLQTAMTAAHRARPSLITCRG